LANQHEEQKVSLAELAAVFLKLGTIAFGGPAAHIAMMEQEFVRKRHWITEADFLDRLGAASLIPGPSSTELAIFIGHAKRGWPGLVVAGSCFIFPAATMVSIIAAGYVRYGSLPRVQGILYAIKPVVIAIILQALWNLARTAFKTRFLFLVGAITLLLGFVWSEPLLVLACGGLLAAAPFLLQKKARPTLTMLPSVATSSALAAVGTGAMVAPVSLARLFLSFLKIGAVVFGSGYVLLAFLRTEFVTRLHWLTEKQLVDAVAVGQVTPGPVFTTATFIGYLLAGVPGALVSTVAIFLPGFFFVAFTGRLLPKIRQSPLASCILDGIVVGSLSLMAVVAWQLGRSAIVDWLTLVLALASLVALLRFRANSVWLIAAAALVGWITKT
jgi:chromate transporter